MEWKDWCRQAVGHVRFRPDRKAIERELTAHYEDHRLDLERVGYEPDLAAERALRAMGDADEVGRALDRAHKPWLGWLWEVSRVLVVGLVVLILGTAAFSGYGWEAVRDWTLFSQRQSASAAFPAAEELTCPTPVQAGAYTITVERACYGELEDGTGYLHLNASCTTGQFWLEGPDLWDTLEAVDSGGTRYRYGRAPWITGFKDDSHILSRGWITVENIPAGTAWVELTHPMGGWSIRVELPEREART